MVRYKKRYLILFVKLLKSRSNFIKTESLKASIVKVMKTLYGEFGVATALSGFHVKYCNSATGIFYVRVNREKHSLVAASIPFISAIGNEEAKVSCIFKAATIRHANIFLKEYQKRKLLQEAPSGEGESLLGLIRGQEMNESDLTLRKRVLLRRKKRV